MGHHSRISIFCMKKNEEPITVVENQDLETGIRSYWLSFNFNLHVVESKPSNSQVMESQQNHVGRIWYANPNPLQGGQSNTMQSQRRIAG